MGVEVVLDGISSGFNRARINNNFDLVQTALEDALSRSGDGDNEMNADLDMNGNDILNASSIQTDSLMVDGQEFMVDAVTAKGDPGEDATVTVGTVSTGAAGTDVIITNVGVPTAAVFNFTIPRGDTGASGAGTGDMLAAQNLNDVGSKPTAFSNIKQAATTSATGVVELAIASEYQGKTATTVLTPDIVWGAMTVVTLVDGASVPWDLSTGIDFQLTLGGNRTLANPSNAVAGQRGRIKVIQDVTGNRTLTKSSNMKLAGGGAISLSTAGNSIDYIDYDVVSATEIRLVVSKAWS